MSARECPCQFNGRWQRENGPDPRCDACLGTGKVWPSVEGEIVNEMVAVPIYRGCRTLLVHVAANDISTYRLIVQKVGE